MRVRQSMSLALFQWSLLGGLAITNALLLAGVLLSTDIAQVWQKGSDTLAAYEARLAQLGASVDSLRFRELSNLGGAPLKVQELTDLQIEVKEQLGTLLALAMTAAPHDAMTIETFENEVALASATSGSGPLQLVALEADLETVKQENAAALAQLSIAADRSTNIIVAELSKLGPTLDIASLGSGGPLIPVPDLPPNTGELDVREAVSSLDRLVKARRAIDDIPIHQPLQTAQISSGFGGRTDPFTGQSAFHSGIDFPAPTGTPVRSAGSGIVTFVGWKGDYGNLIEVTHDAGLVSRYPHLSKTLVQVGDQIEADMEIALVGSTGRSTGPHLHFELRDETGAIDPAPYLAAGKRLKIFES